MGAVISLVFAEIALVVMTALSGVSLSKSSDEKSVKMYNGINIGIGGITFLVTLVVAIVAL